MNTGDERRSQMLAKFRRVTAERLNKLIQGLDALQASPDNENLKKDLMREIHTVKGEAKIMKFLSANKTAHRIEDIMLMAMESDCLESVREQIFVGLDLIAELAQSPGPDELLEASVDEFLAFTETLAPSRLAEEPSREGTSQPQSDDQRKSGPEQPPADVRKANAAEIIQNKDDSSKEPISPASTKKIQQNQDYVNVSGKELTSLTNLAGDLRVSNHQIDRLFYDIERIGMSILAEVEHATHIMDKDGRALFEGLRRQDPLVKIAAFGRELHSTLMRGRDDFFENDLQLGVLQDQIRRMRMVRVGEVFEKHARGIREIAREQGKKTQVILSGEDIVMDKQVLDLLDELLLHLCRNAVDHGLQRADRRRASAKPEQGRIELIAREVGGHIEVIVQDDGVGIDPNAIRSTAVDRGVLSPDQAASLTDAAVLHLLFESGFSTRKTATDISGRGVGLDVVASQLAEVGGSVQVESELGVGTRFVLRTPVSVAFSKILVFKAGNELYALPSIAIEKALRISGAELQKEGEGLCLVHDGQPIPVFSMRDVVGISSQLNLQNGKLNIIILQAGIKTALLVDDIIGQREVVRKNLNPFSMGNALINGTAELEGRRLVLFLHLPELIRRLTNDRTSFSAPTTNQPTDSSSSDPTKSHLLVVDDSELTRDMLVSLLERLGYDVTEAIDGVDALEAVDRKRPDLVLTDLDMPVMDGFTLTERLRQDPKTQDIPIIVISTRGSDADKKKAAEVGADGYIVKSAFRAEEFNRTLKIYLNAGR